jgi:hypothetical protein
MAKIYAIALKDKSFTVTEVNVGQRTGTFILPLSEAPDHPWIQAFESKLPMVGMAQVDSNAQPPVIRMTCETALVKEIIDGVRRAVRQANEAENTRGEEADRSAARAKEAETKLIEEFKQAIAQALA